MSEPNIEALAAALDKRPLTPDEFATLVAARVSDAVAEQVQEARRAALDEAIAAVRNAENGREAIDALTRLRDGAPSRHRTEEEEEKE